MLLNSQTDICIYYITSLNAGMDDQMTCAPAIWYNMNAIIRII